jgi:hypothetical protein
MSRITIDRIAFVGIFVAALALFTWDRNVELQGDDDFSVAMRAAGIANTFRIPEADGPLQQIASFFINLDFNLVNLRHGSFPLFYHGLSLRLFELLDLPFSLTLIHFPLAVIAALSCVMLFALLRSVDLDRFTAFATTALMMFSPVYLMASRGIATYYMLVPEFTTLLCLLALSRPLESRSAKVFLAFAIFNLFLGETLFFLVFPALAIAFLTARAGWPSSASDVGATLRRYRQVAKPLGHPVIVATAVATLVATLQATFDFWRLAPERVRLTRLGSLKSAHLETGMPVISDLDRLSEYTSLLAGEIFPIILPIGLLWILIRRVGIEWNLVTAYGAMAGIGFAILFYGILQPGEWLKVAYQIYVLLPALLVFAVVLNALLDPQRTRAVRVVSGSLAVLAVVSAAASSLAFVWGHPDAVFRPEAFAFRPHGANHPNSGSKGLGFLVREALADHTSAGGTGTVRFYATQHPRIYTGAVSASLRVFAGVQEDMAKNFNYPFAIVIENLLDAPKMRQLARCPGAYCAVLDLRDARAVSGFETRQLRYEVHERPVDEGATPIATLLVITERGDHAPSWTPGRYELARLEDAFDRKFTTFADFLPRGTYNNN